MALTIEQKLNAWKQVLELLNFHASNKEMYSNYICVMARNLADTHTLSYAQRDYILDIVAAHIGGPNRRYQIYLADAVLTSLHLLKALGIDRTRCTDETAKTEFINFLRRKWVESNILKLEEAINGTLFK